MKLVFFGTSGFALEALKRLKKTKHVILAVITQPDRPAGRHLKIMPSPVKEWVLKNNIECCQPDNLYEIEPNLRNLQADLFIVVDYGKMLPEDIIKIPKYFSMNIHPSLLPKYRGAAPVNWVIIKGETETGVTIFRLNEGLDTGDIILKKRFKIDEKDTNLTLEYKLSLMGAEMLVEALKIIEEGKVEFISQDEHLSAYAPKLKKETGVIDWMKEAKDIYNLIRGTQGWPGAFTKYKNKKLKIYEAGLIIREVNFKRNTQPGEIVSLGKDGSIIVATGKGYLSILRLQPEGKIIMLSRQFIMGYRLREGEVLG